MSARVKLITGSISAFIVLLTLSVTLSFFLFYAVCFPYFGDRLRENLGHIAAGYFPIAGLIILVLTGIGSVWMSASSLVNIAEPMRRIKRAAAEIREGNLGYELIMPGRGAHDEFTELAASFEQMRVRLKNSTREKQIAEDERSAMMASVCHDLKTPITSILGYVEGILDGIADTPEKMREYALVIRKKAYALRDLADDLSLLSKLENAQLPLTVELRDIGELTNEIAGEFARENSVQIITENLSSGMTVRLDSRKYARVVLNLLQNSVKYKRPDTALEIGITAAWQDGNALLTFFDNGMGISRQEIPRVFDRFYRADESRGKQPGSGLGLSIARQIVQLHNGKIWMTTGKENGVAVNILLPLWRETNGETETKNTDNRR